MIEGSWSDGKIVTAHLVRDCLVVPVQGDLADSAIEEMRRAVLERIAAESVGKVALDLSGVPLIDRSQAEMIFDLARGAQIMGAGVVMSGLRPGVASALVDLGFEGRGVPIAACLERAIEMLDGRVVRDARERHGAQHRLGA